MSRVVFHIGYHRTASTFLQDRVLPAMAVDAIIKPDVRALITDDAFAPAPLRAAWLGASRDPTRPRVISAEQLSGRPAGGPPAQKLRTADRLYALCPEAHVLLVIRNQLDLLLSIYSYRVLLRGLESRDLATWIEANADELRGGLCYDALVGHYQARFGAAHVHVVPFELLRRGQGVFLAEIASAIGAPAPTDLPPATRVNESTRSARLLRVNRALNVPLDRTLRPLRARGTISGPTYLRLARPYFLFKDRLLNPLLRRRFGDDGPRLEVPPAVLGSLGALLRASNARLAAMIGRDLGELGYLLP